MQMQKMLNMPSEVHEKVKKTLKIVEILVNNEINWMIA